MKNYLKIQSKGEIEIEAFKLIGASSKRNDETKIGFYGSGLKYSIASMLRNGIDFKIFQGEKEIKFTTQETNFRNENYLAICVNGEKTSMTTTMGGSDWNIAFAPIREIYSNALDEDEEAFLSIEKELNGQSGKTTFYIEKTEGVTHFYDNHELYFCNRNPNVLVSNKYFSVYPISPDSKIRLFRKGILCYINEYKDSLFNYNSTLFQINESRILSYLHDAKANISRGWKMCSNKKLISELIDGIKGGNFGKFEHDLDWSWNEPFSNEWYEVLKDYKFVPVEMITFAKPKDLVNRVVLSKTLLLPLYRQFEDLDILGFKDKDSETFYIEEKEPSEILTDKVVDALEILRKTRYASRLKNIDIIYATFQDNDVLGMAEKGKIILSTKLESDDVPYIAKIIIEENEHNISGHSDETRNFQNHLFKLFYDELTAKH